MNRSHGLSGYRGGCRCKVCRAANTAASRAFRRRKKGSISGVPHGTKHGYSNWSCRCDLCKAANKAQYTAWKTRQSPENAPHGTRTGYCSYGCRCQPCHDAQMAWQREYRARKKASA